MHYNFTPITMSINIGITFVTCITDSILQQCPSPSPSCLSNALQIKSYNNVHHNRHHVYHIPYKFNPMTMSITIAINVYHMHYGLDPVTMFITIAVTFITCITASSLKQCQSPLPSQLSQVIQFRSYNNVHNFHHHRHHVYHIYYSFDPKKMFISSITISITCISCITASIL